MKNYKSIKKQRTKKEPALEAELAMLEKVKVVESELAKLEKWNQNQNPKPKRKQRQQHGLELKR